MFELLFVGSDEVVELVAVHLLLELELVVEAAEVLEVFEAVVAADLLQQPVYFPYLYLQLPDHGEREEEQREGEREADDEEVQEHILDAIQEGVFGGVLSDGILGLHEVLHHVLELALQDLVEYHRDVLPDGQFLQVGDLQPHEAQDLGIDLLVLCPQVHHVFVNLADARQVVLVLGLVVGVLGGLGQRDYVELPQKQTVHDYVRLLVVLELLDADAQVLEAAHCQVGHPCDSCHQCQYDGEVEEQQWPRRVEGAQFHLEHLDVVGHGDEGGAA